MVDGEGQAVLTIGLTGPCGGRELRVTYLHRHLPSGRICHRRLCGVLRMAAGQIGLKIQRDES